MMTSSESLQMFVPSTHNRHKPYALDLSLSEWRIWCAQENLPGYNAKQIYQWIFQKCQVDPQIYTNLPSGTRAKLMESFSWDLPIIDSHLISKDGSEKFLMVSHDKQLFEMVLMPYDNRATLCVSSQIGCQMGCTFCQTGKMGLKRNLSSGEILSQLIIANQSLKEMKLSNVVFMGMGEPLDNYMEVVKSCAVMVDAEGFGLSKSKVTVSTSGLVPEIRQLGKDLPVRLAISLHTADDAKRSRMMPINRTYNLATLKEALLDYPAPPRVGITFEYVMIQGENDTIEDAKKLVSFLHGLKAKVNLIPINHFPGIPMKASEAERIKHFQDYLTARSIPAPVRYSRGQDISGGCGQLAAKRENELAMDPRVLHRERRKLAREE